MVALNMTFDPAEAPVDEFESVPAGTYVMTIVDGEIREMGENGSKGSALNLRFQIDGGDHDGRAYFEWLNLWHATSEQAVTIAQQTLGKIVTAAGTGPISDTEELYGIPLVVTLKERKDKRTGETRIQAGSFAPYNSAPQSAPQPMQRPTPVNNNAAPPAANGQRRWGNRG